MPRYTHRTQPSIRPQAHRSLLNRWFTAALITTAVPAIGSQPLSDQAFDPPTTNASTPEQAEIWDSLSLDADAIDELIARAGVRYATARMRALANRDGSLSSIDYATTALTLESARSMLPANTTLLRRELEAWSLAGFGEEAERLTRELLMIDPTDEIAQLRLILNRIDRMQTVSERRAAYERLLGDTSGAFSAPLRSRLALDLANLCREMGDDRAFIEALTRATTLDVTNKSAAALYASYVLPFAQTDLERVEILLNVVLADPLDPQAMLTLARELFRVGAYNGGRRFLSLALSLKSRAGIPPTEDENVLVLISGWRTDGPEEMLSRIAQQQARVQGQADAEREERVSEGFDVGDYEEETLVAKIELMRLLALLSLQDEAAGAAFSSVSSQEQLEKMGGLPVFKAAPAFTEIAEQYPDEVLRAYWRTVRSLKEDIERQIRVRAWAEGNAARPEFVDPQLENIILSMPERAIIATYETEGAALLERVLVRMGLGLEIEKAREDLDTLRANEGSTALTPEATMRFDAWLQVLEGDAQQAIPTLKQLAESGDTLSYVALGSAYERIGDTNGAALSYLRIAKQQPTTALGIYAETRASQLLDRPISPGAIQSEIDEYTVRTMPWIETLISQPQSVLEFRAEPVQQLVPPLSMPRIRISLRNASPHPLGIGTDAPISQRILLTPSVVVGGLRYPTDLRNVFINNAIAEARSRNSALTMTAAENIADARLRVLENQLLEMVRFENRLRLNSGEEITVELDVGFTPLGRTIQQTLRDRMRFRWRASHGFVVRSAPTGENEQSRGSTYVAGPQSLSADTPIIVRTGLPLEIEIPQLINSLQASQGDQRLVEAMNLISLVGITVISSVETQQAADNADQTLSELVAELDQRQLDLLFTHLSEVGFQRKLPLLSKALVTSLTSESAPAALSVALLGFRLYEPYIDPETLVELAQGSGLGALHDLADVTQEILNIRSEAADSEASTP